MYKNLRNKKFYFGNGRTGYIACTVLSQNLGCFKMTNKNYISNTNHLKIH